MSSKLVTYGITGVGIFGFLWLLGSLFLPLLVIAAMGMGAIALNQHKKIETYEREMPMLARPMNNSMVIDYAADRIKEHSRRW